MKRFYSVIILLVVFLGCYPEKEGTGVPEVAGPGPGLKWLGDQIPHKRKASDLQNLISDTESLVTIRSITRPAGLSDSLKNLTDSGLDSGYPTLKRNKFENQSLKSKESSNSSVSEREVDAKIESPIAEKDNSETSTLEVPAVSIGPMKVEDPSLGSSSTSYTKNEITTKTTTTTVTGEVVTRRLSTPEQKGDESNASVSSGSTHDVTALEVTDPAVTQIDRPKERERDQTPSMSSRVLREAPYLDTITETSDNETSLTSSYSITDDNQVSLSSTTTTPSHTEFRTIVRNSDNDLDSIDLSSDVTIQDVQERSS